MVVEGLALLDEKEISYLKFRCIREGTWGSYEKLDFGRFRINRSLEASIGMGSEVQVSCTLSQASEGDLEDLVDAVALHLGKEYARMLTPTRVEAGYSGGPRGDGMHLRGDPLFEVVKGVVERAKGRHRQRGTSSSLVDQLVDVGIPEEVLVGNEGLWELLAKIDRNTLPSYNATYFVRDKRGAQWLLKVTRDHGKAKLAAGANYHLAQEGLDFIVPGMTPEALVGNGYSLLLQKRVMDTRTRSLDYWLRTLGKFHASAGEVLERNGVVVPRVMPVRDAGLIVDQWRRTRAVHGQSFDLGKIYASVDYLRDVRGRERGNTLVIHRDLKADNLLGAHMIDLDNMSYGDPCVDLALLFFNYGVPENGWARGVQLYLDGKGFVGDRLAETRALVFGVKMAAPYVIAKEIAGSSARRMTEEGARRNARYGRQLGELELAA